jgi:hypothetical protein
MPQNFYSIHTVIIFYQKCLKYLVFLKQFTPELMQTFLHLLIYKTYILPILEYSNLCFSPNKTQIIKIEKVQKNITKYICNKTKLFDLTYEQRLKYLELKSLENWRYIQILILIFNIKRKLNRIPKIWFNEINFTINNRNGTYISVNKYRINLCDKSFSSYAKCTVYLIICLNLYEMKTNSQFSSVKSTNILNNWHFCKTFHYSFYASNIFDLIIWKPHVQG